MTEDDFDYEFDTYSFYYTAADADPEREFEGHSQLPWDAPWTMALEHYLEFLSRIYGYSLKDQVAVEYNPNRDPAGWTGPVFGGHKESSKSAQLELFPKDNYGGTD